jgi:hypothetical protein
VWQVGGRTEGLREGWRPVQLAYENALFDQQFTHKPVQKFSSDDLRQVRDQVLAEQRKKGASEQALRRTGDGLERLIAEGGRAVCGNIGMSYTGEWECTAQQQRVKCK